jgi:N-acetylmuramoyl-L-alanine amidase
MIKALSQYSTVRAALAAATFLSAALFACAALAEPARIEMPAAPAGSVAAVDVRVENAGRETRLVFTLNACVDHQTYVLDQPARAVVDLPEVAFLIDPSHGDRSHGGHSREKNSRRAGKADAAPLSYRFGRLSPGKSRIIVDLPAPAEFSASCAAAKAGVAELTLTMKPGEPAAFRAAARAGAEKQAQEAKRELVKRDAASAISPPKSQPGEVQPGQKPLIVLDPGHGGVDAGTMGADETVEKNVVLDFAKALAAPLRASGRYRVAFTREDDTFVPLQERVHIAQRLGAALFVSIHADSLRGGAEGVHGATVYTVSERASDSEAARVAESENNADSLAGLEAQEQAGEINDILFDLTRRETRAFSNIFAQYLSERWKVAATLNKNPRRFAGFVVLKAPDVPSVLLELGYLSSPRDAADLTSPQWREKAAAQAARAIDDFFSSRQPAPAIAPAAQAQP